jgi:hypothetical protein
MAKAIEMVGSSERRSHLVLTVSRVLNNHPPRVCSICTNSPESYWRLPTTATFSLSPITHPYVLNIVVSYIKATNEYEIRSPCSIAKLRQPTTPGHGS